MPRDTRSLYHKTEPRLEVFTGMPSDREGQDGDKRFCFIPDKGLYHYVKYLGKWMASPAYEETLGKLNKRGLQTDNITSDHDIRLNPARNVEIKEKKDIGTGDFNSSFVAGTGWRVRHTDNEYNMEVDSLTVRGTLHVYEMLIQQLRATNGTVVVTSAAKVDSVSGNDVTFDDPSGHGVCPFAVNDIIMCQRVSLNSATVVKRIVRRVTAVNGATITVTRDGDLPADTLSIVKGDDFVRIGNTGTASRRGGVIITSDLANAPYVEVFDGVLSWTTWTSVDKTKARLGQLAGIVDAQANLDNDTKFGLYTDDVHLKGHIHSQSGEIAGWTLSSTALTKSDTTLSSSGTLTLGTSANIVKLSAVDDNYRIWAGHADAASAKFSVSKTGILAATEAVISGAITATSGTFTGAINASSGTFTGYVAGGNMKFGVDVSGSNDGLFIDANDYWYDNGNFSLGNGNLTWNGSALSVTGGGTFTGALSGGTISIGSSNSIFKADSNGIYLGNATFGSAPFRVTPDGQLTATSGTFSGSITGASGTFSGNLQIGSGESVFKADSNGIYLGNETFGSAEFRVTPAGVVTATNIVLTAASGSTFNNGTVGGFSVSGTGFSNSNINCATDGSVMMAAEAMKIYPDGDLYLHQMDQTDDDDSTRRGILMWDSAGVNGTHWKIYHNHQSHDYTMLYNNGAGSASTMCSVTSDGTVKSYNGFREGIGSAHTECEIHNNNVQLYANVSDNARYFQVRNTDNTPENNHTMGGLRCYVTAHHTLTNNSGWNGLVYFKTPNTGSAADLTGKVSVGFRAGDSAAAQWWKFAHDGSSYNAKDDADWDTSSDERVKENITNVSSALTTLDALRPVTFNFTDDFVAKTDFPSSKKWGFVAQEFKNVISEGVTIRPSPDYDDFHSLNTSMLVPILVKAVQELKAEVEELKNGS